MMTKTESNDNNETKKKTIDQSSVTDESSFGSCEPGTSVVLEGIVWNETDKGKQISSICFSFTFLRFLFTNDRCTCRQYYLER